MRTHLCITCTAVIVWLVGGATALQAATNHYGTITADMTVGQLINQVEQTIRANSPDGKDKPIASTMQMWSLLSGLLEVAANRADPADVAPPYGTVTGGATTNPPVAPTPTGTPLVYDAPARGTTPCAQGPEKCVSCGGRPPRRGGRTEGPTSCPLSDLGGIAFLAMVCVNVLFAFGVTADAFRTRREYGRLRFLPALLWFPAILCGGLPVVALYWLAHHSTLARG